MRTRELMRRNTEALERFIETTDRQAAAFDRQAAAFDRQARTLENQAQVLRVLVADLRHFGETLDRRTDALLDSFAALTAEIRGWRSDSGPGAA
jgi:hypothetical protein